MSYSANKKGVKFFETQCSFTFLLWNLATVDQRRILFNKKLKHHSSVRVVTGVIAKLCHRYIFSDTSPIL